MKSKSSIIVQPPHIPAPLIGRKWMHIEIFKKILQEGKLPTDKGEWDDRVRIRANILSHQPEIIFNQIEIDKEILITQIENPISLIFSDCDLAACSFINVKKISSIIFESKSNIGEIKVHSVSMNRVIIRNSTIGNISIENSKIDDIEALDNSSIGDFLIKDLISHKINIENESIAGNFLINNLNTLYYLISKNSKTETISINGQFNAGTLLIDNSQVKSLAIIGENRIFQCFIFKSKLGKIEIKNGVLLSYLQCEFNLQEPTHIILEQSSIVLLDFRNRVLPEFNTIFITNCNINQLLISEFCNYGTITFSGLQPLEKWMAFKTYKNGLPYYKSKFKFYEANADSIFCLKHSELGKTQFINSDLRQFKRFEFSNTKMLDVFVAGSQMPEDKAFVLPDDEKNPLKIAEQKRLAYGQFKKIYEARGDMAGSLRYLAYEMDAYFWQIVREKPWKIGELIMLGLNKISTNYGNNWGQGALVTLAVIFLCFANYLRLIGYECGEWDEVNVKLFKELFSYAPQYLNPFRDADSVIPGIKNEDLRPAARVWDYASRVIVAYFIYQTIQAFRKLGKSSG